MPMRTHELHPSLVHAPLALLPAAAIADLYGAASDRPGSGRAGRVLWAATAASGLAAGLAGMAASQQIRLEGKHTKDMMWLHGLGNVSLVVAAAGVAVWRAKNGPSWMTGLLGLGATAAALYTAWLGGELVYSHGAGVKALEREDQEPPPLFSREAPAVLARDAGLGLGWLLRRTRSAFRGEQGVEAEAFGPEAARRVGSRLVPVETGAYPP